MAFAATSASVLRRFAPKVPIERLPTFHLRHKALAAGTFGVAAAGLVHCPAASSTPLRCDGAAVASDVVPFTMDKPYYDPSTYAGRVRNVLDMIDARLLLVTDDELQLCQSMLEKYKAGTLEKGVMDEELWRARRVVEGIVHPVTGEKMFILGRMSAFVLVNLPVAAGMLIHGPTSTGAAVFWQWVNQSNNVMCNFVNRSGASVDWTGILQSYGLATSVSCGLALAAGKVMEKSPRLKRFGIIVPYFAVISASTANMFFSRLSEWTKGVPVFDEEGTERGTSARAGLEGVVRTVTTRAWIIPVPLLLATPVVMQGLQKVPFIASSSALLIFSELTCIALCLQLALPLVLAMQPATMKLQACHLEPNFHDLKDSKGKPIEFLYANKGL